MAEAGDSKHIYGGAGSAPTLAALVDGENLRRPAHRENGARAQSPSWPRRHVSEAQRTRILSATVDLLYERGPEATAVSHVIGFAGVSRRTFYELFEDRNACIVAAIDQALALAQQRVAVACSDCEPWIDRIRAGLLELLRFFDDEPRLAWLLVVHSAAAGTDAMARRRMVLEQLAHFVEEGRGETRADPSPLTAEGLVGGVLTVVHTRLVRRTPDPLTDLLQPLMGLIVQPYLGAGAARKEFSMPPPEIRRKVVRSRSAPLLGTLNVRLTYRTMAVLRVIAGEPGLSNKEISERVGITDQGQMSRLLGRLGTRGLLKNTGAGPAMGATNAWSLTLKGEAVERALRAGGLESVNGSREPGRSPRAGDGGEAHVEVTAARPRLSARVPVR